MSLPPFVVAFDDRCPFARPASEHLVLALQGGAERSSLSELQHTRVRR